MGDAGPTVRISQDAEGILRLSCPGCERVHRVMATPGMWTWDGNTEAPTISPSILVLPVPDPSRPTGVRPRCHSFVRAGRWEFLNDCDHDLAGQTVPLPPLPDSLTTPTREDDQR